MKNTKIELEEKWPSLVDGEIPNEAFWSMWQEQKDELKSLGVKVIKQDDGSYAAKLVDPAKAKPTQGDRLRALPPLPTLRDFLAVPKGSRATFFAALDPKICKAAGLSYVPEKIHPAKRIVQFVVKKPNSFDWAFDVTTTYLPAGSPVPEEPLPDKCPESLKLLHGKVHDSPEYSTGDHFELKGISDFALTKSTSLSKRLAKDMAFALSEIHTPAVVNSARSCDSWAREFWNPLLDLPLNEVKANLVDKSRAALSKYFSPEQSAKRRMQEEKNEELRAWAAEGYKPSRAPLFVDL